MANINLVGKSVVITGGSAGIGEGMVNAFNEVGATGIIFDQKPPLTLKEGWQFVECDVTDEAHVIAAFARIDQRYKPFDFLVANAGIVPPWSPIAETPVEVWDKVMAVNSRGLFLTIKHGSSLLRRPDGAIVVTASINSWKGDANIVPYVASKHAALGVVRSAAMDLGRFGIRVNGIGPGPIATDALLSRIEARGSKTHLSVDDTLELLSNQTALGRLATTEDVADVALFLCSDMARGVTGQLINVDAGLL
jgi:NAD(P)-dependent dehydrogenase (short-subunit alcohol dehydrogenase family)